MKTEIIENKIIKILEKISKKKLDKKKMNKINYFNKGYIDSLNFIKFIFLLEDKFKISFTKKEINSSNFKKIEKLIMIIKNKVSNNE